jgi:hypothetical protein
VDRSLAVVVRHFPLHYPGVGSESPMRKEFEEDLVSCFRVRGGEDVRGKNPGATPSFGVLPGGFG